MVIISPVGEWNIFPLTESQSFAMFKTWDHNK